MTQDERDVKMTKFVRLTIARQDGRSTPVILSVAQIVSVVQWHADCNVRIQMEGSNSYWVRESLAEVYAMIVGDLT